ncbi:MAG: hypothetical protein KatS3mg048_3491 [Caldilinea sp.]|nr:MAG: hypothetical protein KatS3mg048_3491 [Caldilinea sp.]
MLPTPGSMPDQLLMITKRKIVATQGKNFEAFLPATLSAKPYSASMMASMKFWKAPGISFRLKRTASARRIRTMSTMIVVKTELVNHLGPVEKIGSPDRATWGGGTGAMNRIKMLAANNPTITLVQILRCWVPHKKSTIFSRMVQNAPLITGVSRRFGWR